jgi:hypothetical protein
LERGVTGYVDQRLTDLRLVVTDVPANRDRFRLYGETRVTTGGYEADLWIIGSSHVMAFSAGPATCSEILTCRSDEHPEYAPEDVTRDLKGVRVERSVGGVASYAVDVETTSFTADDLRDEQRRLLAEADDDCLLHLFPAAERGDLSPLTLVRVVKAEDTVFELTTSHTYPQDLAMVFTHTTIRLP